MLLEEVTRIRVLLAVLSAEEEVGRDSADSDVSMGSTAEGTRSDSPEVEPLLLLLLDCSMSVPALLAMLFLCSNSLPLPPPPSPPPPPLLSPGRGHSQPLFLP